jgi:hypothetical protein
LERSGSGRNRDLFRLADAQPVQRSGQMGHGAVDVVPLFQTEQADAEGHEVGRLVALQRHAGGGLQAFGQELLAVVQARGRWCSSPPRPAP